MSNQSSASGDPYCPTHGFSPCRCWEFCSLYTPALYMAQQNNFPICGGCGKHQGFCMCSGSSDPWNDIRQYQGTLPEGTSICVDVTKPQEEKPVKKLAEELREQAQKFNETVKPEGFSAYVFFMERAKREAKSGKFKVFFWLSDLPWTRQEADLAAELLRKDNFTVNIEFAEDLKEPDTSIEVSWE